MMQSVEEALGVNPQDYAFL